MIIFSGLRQGISVAICFLSCRYIIERKPIKFLLIVVFATFFHYSAIVFIIAYPVFWLKMKRQVRLLSILGIPIVFLLRIPLFLILSKILKSSAGIDNNGAITLLLVFLTVYCFCVVFINEDDELANGFLNLYYLGVLCMCFGGVYLLAMRVAYYFMIALIIALPTIISEIQNQSSRKISSIAVKSAFILYGLYALWSSGSSWPMTYPYHFFWESI